MNQDHPTCSIPETACLLAQGSHTLPLRTSARRIAAAERLREG